MYGDLAKKLIIEAKRTEQLSSKGKKTAKLPVYNDELVRNIIREVSQLKRSTELLRKEQEEGGQHLIEMDNKALKCQYLVNLLCLERNKRCLLAYQKLRCDLLDAFVWENSAISLLGDDSSQDRNDLTLLEQEYLKEYSELVTDLKSGTLADIDLAGSLEPPKEVFIDVRVLKDAGEIQTEYGVFNLIKGSQFFVRQSDVERLIQQGFLQKI